MATTREDVMYEMAMEEKYREVYKQELINKAVKELPEENTFLRGGQPFVREVIRYQYYSIPSLNSW